MTAKRRIVIGTAFAGALLIAVAFPEFRRGLVSMTKPDPIGPAIYSKSALGHAAVFDMLDNIGIPVLESDLGSGAHFDPNGVTVIAEPRTDDTTLTEVRAMLDASTVLLVLPKREGKADPKRPNWIGEDLLIAPSDVQSVLSLADPKATLVRDAATDSWDVSYYGGAQPAIRHAQLVRSQRLRPLLSSPQGILIGEIREHGKRLVVLSDPDLIANHGIARGDNAQIFVRLIENMRSGHDGTVVFDEFIHGYSPRPFHMLGILFQFPFVLVTAQAALGIALLVWAAAGRFGAPREQPPAIDAGRRSLIDAGAALVSRNGDPTALASRYYEEMVRDAAASLRAPAGLALPDLVNWLSESGKLSSHKLTTHTASARPASAHTDPAHTGLVDTGPAQTGPTVGQPFGAADPLSSGSSLPKGRLRATITAPRNPALTVPRAPASPQQVYAWRKELTGGFSPRT
jgi:hypothetical protein